MRAHKLTDMGYEYKIYLKDSSDLMSSSVSLSSVQTGMTLVDTVKSAVQKYAGGITG